MTPRKRRTPPEPEYRPGTLLDWSSSKHWNHRGPAPCRYCGRPACLLDSAGHPAHKTCAETALATQAVEANARYQQNGHIA